MNRFFCTFLLLFYVVVSFFSCAVSQASSPESLSSFNYQAAIPLEDLNQSENINGTFPEQIYIKTLTQTFNRDYQFCIVDGLIYYKLLPDAKYSNSSEKEDVWKLIKGTGLPFPPKGEKFPVPDRIVEIAADADALFAFNSEGGMYQIFTNDDAPSRPFLWIEGFGWPEKTQLKQNVLVKNKRAWASGARRQDVLWHEDIFGNPHHYGTMGIETLYFLTEDGQQIRYTDSGLPADFSRSLLGPERGSFIAENLSSSADTMFVINKAGQMYTRLADFDTIGCDPMFFRYTYEYLPQKYTGEQYLSNYSPWGLPSEPWLLQPEIKLKGKARLTKYITILQNGQGNAARELRVAGLNENAETGYYSKPIMASSSEDWRFVKVPLFFDVTAFLPVTKDGVPKEVKANLYGKKQEMSYTGDLWENGIKNKEIECVIDDFPISEGECTLQITYKDETKKITVHPVEIWSYMFRNNPGLDGTAKNFFITFDYADDFLNTKYPEFSILLEKIFGDKKKVLFSSLAFATDKFFRLSVTQFALRPEMLSSSEKTTYTFFLTNTEKMPKENNSTQRNLMLYESPSVLQFNSMALKINPGTQINISNRNIIDQAILANKRYKQMLETELKLYNKYSSKANLSRWGYNVADLLTSVTLLNQVNFPKIKNITSFGGQIMTQNALTYRMQAGMNNWVYSHVLELLDLRLEVYEKLQEELLEQETVIVPGKLQDNFSDYYTKNAGLPLKLLGNTNMCCSKTAALFLLPEIPSFPGFLLELNDSDSSYLAIELKDSAKTIYNLKKSISKENPLEMKASFFVLFATDKTQEEITKKNKKKGWIYWDGENLLIKEKDGLFGKKTLFSSLN